MYLYLTLMRPTIPEHRRPAEDLPHGRSTVRDGSWHRSTRHVRIKLGNYIIEGGSTIVNEPFKTLQRDMHAACERGAVLACGRIARSSWFVAKEATKKSIPSISSPMTRAWLKSSSSAGRRIQYRHEIWALTTRKVWLLEW